MSTHSVYIIQKQTFIALQRATLNSRTLADSLSLKQRRCHSLSASAGELTSTATTATAAAAAAHSISTSRSRTYSAPPIQYRSHPRCADVTLSLSLSLSPSQRRLFTAAACLWACDDEYLHAVLIKCWRSRDTDLGRHAVSLAPIPRHSRHDYHVFARLSRHRLQADRTRPITDTV